MSEWKHIKRRKILKVAEAVITFNLLLWTFQILQVFFTSSKDYSLVNVIEHIIQSFTTSEDETFMEAIFELITLFTTNTLYIVVAISMLSLYETSIMENKAFKNTLSTIVAICMVNGVIFVFAVFTSRGVYEITIARTIITVIVQVFIVVSFKMIFLVIFSKYTKKVAIAIGPKEEVRRFATKFYSDQDKRIVLKYVVYEENIGEKMFSLIDSCENVYLTPSTSAKIKNKVLTHCVNSPYITVHLIPKLYELALVGARTNTDGDILSFNVSSLHMDIVQRFVKRTMDLLISIPLLILASPLLLVTAIAIKIEDGGNVFYLQDRVTIGRRVFSIYKVRSMTQRVEKVGEKVVPASTSDARITKTGAFIRKTRIDEIPQLINVVKGDMSLIGPRALALSNVQDFLKENHNFKYRFNIKAGVTGYAQVMGKYDTSADDKLRFDLLYIRNLSLLTDLKILLYTVRTVIDITSTRGDFSDKDLSQVLEENNISYIESNDYLVVTGEKM